MLAWFKSLMMRKFSVRWRCSIPVHPEMERDT
jgi:hypothetical protein